MVTLTSIDYARLIQFVAANIYHTLLNKTQVNKILFYIYGAYLVFTELISNQAWSAANFTLQAVTVPPY